MTNPQPTPTSSHRATYRVRFDESTPAGVARTSVLLRYAQDVAWAHSEALGFDRAWYAERGLAWLVRAAELAVLRPIPMGSLLEVVTSVVGHRRVWARRRGEFRLEGQGGDGLIAWVHTDWVLIDGRGRITRVPEVFGTTFPAPLSNDTLGRVALPAAPTSAVRGRFRVRAHELDPMDHVNNAVYVDWLEESILAAGADDGSGAASIARVPRRYRLEYAAAAAAGVEVETETWPDGEGWAHRTIAAGVDMLRARLDR
ncbi:MAG TPA: acyl-ACP thioesterase domain-containing protein [Candidatus Limnocylindrales bacterium]|jgi:acyl-CoA thioesterase FadM|nr:acyl-ACP thioesterase domain-containing protein [Candidatus Limnocylindrales bacterium]